MSTSLICPPQNPPRRRWVLWDPKSKWHQVLLTEPCLGHLPANIWGHGAVPRGAGGHGGSPAAHGCADGQVSAGARHSSVCQELKLLGPAGGEETFVQLPLHLICVAPA